MHFVDEMQKEIDLGILEDKKELEPSLLEQSETLARMLDDHFEVPIDLLETPIDHLKFIQEVEKILFGGEE